MIVPSHTVCLRGGARSSPLALVVDALGCKQALKGECVCPPVPSLLTFMVGSIVEVCGLLANSYNFRKIFGVKPTLVTVMFWM